MMANIITAVVRLSKFAERPYVMKATSHNSRLLLRVMIHSLMKSKHPLEFSRSTMDMVANRYSTIWQMSATWAMKTWLAMKFFKDVTDESLPARNSAYSSACSKFT